MNKFFNFKFKSLHEDERIIEGLATTFGNKDLDGDIIEPGAFDDQLGETPELVVKALWQHRFDQPIGLNTVTKNPEGLFIRMKLAEGVRLADEALALAKQGVIDSFSIGFRILKEEFSREMGANIISLARLRETSLVTFPANPLAKISDVKNAKDHAQLKSLIVEALRNGACGLSIKDAEAVCAKGLPGLGNLDGVDDDGKYKGKLIEHLLKLT